jgi:mevalonate kinase
MPAFSASAPGKIILFGEHAVVYARPAIAVPVQQVRAKAIVTAEPHSAPGVVRLRAPDIRLDAALGDLPEEHPLAAAVWRRGCHETHPPPSLPIQVTSSIPIAGEWARGAVTWQSARLLSLLGSPVSDEEVSSLAYEVEVIHHGTSSGIDNTVITCQAGFLC